MVLANWSFLTSHAQVLTYVGEHPESTGLGIAQAVGLTERAVRKILADLQAGGYVTSERVGRRNRYHVHADLELTVRGERTITVGQLIALLWPEFPLQDTASGPVGAR